MHEIIQKMRTEYEILTKIVEECKIFKEQSSIDIERSGLEIERLKSENTTLNISDLYSKSSILASVVVAVYSAKVASLVSACTLTKK